MLAEFDKMSHTQKSPATIFFLHRNYRLMLLSLPLHLLLFLLLLFLKVGILWQSVILLQSSRWFWIADDQQVSDVYFFHLITQIVISDSSVLLTYHILATFSESSCPTFPLTHEYLQGLHYLLERQHEILTIFLKNTNVTLVTSENNNATQHKSSRLGKNILISQLMILCQDNMSVCGSVKTTVRFCSVLKYNVWIYLHVEKVCPLKELQEIAFNSENLSSLCLFTYCSCPYTSIYKS